MVIVNLREVVVTEGMSVEVCLLLHNQERISGSAFVTLITDDTQTETNVNRKYA